MGKHTTRRPFRIFDRRKIPPWTFAEGQQHSSSQSFVGSGKNFIRFCGIFKMAESFLSTMSESFLSTMSSPAIDILVWRDVQETQRRCPRWQKIFSRITWWRETVKSVKKHSQTRLFYSTNDDEMQSNDQCNVSAERLPVIVRALVPSTVSSARPMGK